MKVLIVDDSRFMRNMIKKILLEEGYLIAGEASNGIEAVEMYKKMMPDIVTLDLTMPLKGGVEALKEIIEYDKDANVIMISAMGQQSLIIETIQNGAKDFLVKPFTKEKFSDVLNNLDL